MPIFNVDKTVLHGYSFQMLSAFQHVYRSVLHPTAFKPSLKTFKWAKIVRDTGILNIETVYNKLIEVGVVQRGLVSRSACLMSQRWFSNQHVCVKTSVLVDALIYCNQNQNSVVFDHGQSKYPKIKNFVCSFGKCDEAVLDGHNFRIQSSRLYPDFKDHDVCQPPSRFISDL